MATVMNTATVSGTTNKDMDRRWLSSFRPAVFAILGILVLLGAARIYQQVFGWSAGMDSTSPEFNTYWRNLFIIEIITLPICWVLVCGYLWVTRDRHLDKIKPEVELKRTYTLIAWLLVYVVTFFSAAFFAEQDATWHQTVVRDTSITPSHVILFYGILPLTLLFGFASFTYAMTRLPKFANGISVPFILAVGGPFLILPNLGYNEWGHAYWLLEETFGAPLHWGFVVLGWSALAFGGLFLQLLFDATRLLPLVFKDDAKVPAGYR